MGSLESGRAREGKAQLSDQKGQLKGGIKTQWQERHNIKLTKLLVSLRNILDA